MYRYHDDDLEYYEKEISKYKIFTKEEEIEYFTRYKNGEDVLDEIVKRNSRLVISIARNYLSYVKGSSFSFMDLIEYGNIGLLIAIDRYDLNQKYKFSTYAKYWIKHEISIALQNSGYTLRIPINLYNKKRLMDKAYDKLLIELNREPTDEELAKEINVKPKKILDIKEMTKRQATAQSDGFISILDKRLFRVEDETDKIMDKFRNKLLYDILKNVNLSEIQYKILVLRYGLIDGKKRTLDEIANICNVSKSYIGQEEIHAFEKIRRSHYIYLLASYFENSKELLKNIGKTDNQIECFTRGI